MPVNGGWNFFSDPHLRSPQTSVFWHPSVYGGILKARFQQGRQADTIGLSKRFVAADKVLLLAGDGRIELSIYDQTERFNIECYSNVLSIPAFSAEFIVGNFPYVEKQIQRIKSFAHFLKDQRGRLSERRATVEALRHRDAIAALDLRLTGKSYRQIGCFINGTDAVLDDWNNPNQAMKNRTIRSVKRGFRMMNGGYKKLLI